MVPSHFHDVTDEEIWRKKQDHTYITLSSVQCRKTRIFTRRTYSDISEETCGCDKCDKFWTCSKLLLQLLNNL